MAAVNNDQDRQMRLMMFMLMEIRPGCVCADTRCPQANFSGIPHMANDGRNHPHPYGLISSPAYEWRRKPWWRRRRGSVRRDRALVENGWQS